MDDLLAEFLAETRETLDALSGEIIAWEADPSDRGRLDIGAEKTANGTEMVVRAEGPRLVLDAELRQALEGQTAAADVTPRAAAAFLVSELARQANGGIQVSAPGDPFVMFGAMLRDG